MNTFFSCRTAACLHHPSRHQLPNSPISMRIRSCVHITSIVIINPNIDLRNMLLNVNTIIKSNSTSQPLEVKKIKLLVALSSLPYNLFILLRSKHIITFSEQADHISVVFFLFFFFNWRAIESILSGKIQLSYSLYFQKSLISGLEKDSCTKLMKHYFKGSFDYSTFVFDEPKYM